MLLLLPYYYYYSVVSVLPALAEEVEMGMLKNEENPRKPRYAMYVCNNVPKQAKQAKVPYLTYLPDIRNTYVVGHMHAWEELTYSYSGLNFNPHVSYSLLFRLQSSDQRVSFARLEPGNVEFCFQPLISLGARRCQSLFLYSRRP